MMFTRRPIPDTDGYEAGSDGSVWIGARRLKASPWGQGYPVVHVRASGKRKLAYVHDLVAAAFIGPKPDGMEVRHRDGVRLNCAASNLRYGTRSQNQRDRLEHGTDCRGERHVGCKLSDCRLAELRRLREAGWGVRRIARHLKVSPALVSMVLSGKRRSYVDQ